LRLSWFYATHRDELTLISMRWRYYTNDYLFRRDSDHELAEI